MHIHRVPYLTGDWDALQRLVPEEIRAGPSLPGLYGSCSVSSPVATLLIFSATLIMI